MISRDKVTEIFCIIDELCKIFEAENAEKLLFSNPPNFSPIICISKRPSSSSLLHSVRCHMDFGEEFTPVLVVNQPLPSSNVQKTTN